LGTVLLYLGSFLFCWRFFFFFFFSLNTRQEKDGEWFLDPHGTLGPVSVATTDSDGNVETSCVRNAKDAAIMFGIQPSVVEKAKRTAFARRDVRARERAEIKSRQSQFVPHKLTSRVAQFFVEYLDPPGFGFLSTAAADALSTTNGNPGENLGSQRRVAFEEALLRYTSVLDSDIPINVSAIFTPLPCSASGGVLGFAGTAFGTFNNIWYGNALRNRLRGQDLSTTNYDVFAQFNPNVGNSNCFSGGGWYYAGYTSVTGSIPPGRSDFFTTALHEVGHGLGNFALLWSV
jgi:hypothetical protein